MNKLRADIVRYRQLSGQSDVSRLQMIVSVFNPRLAPVVLLRLSEFFFRHHLGPVSKLFSILNVLFFGIEASPRVEIGGGLFLPHTVGTVIGAARIGENVTIMQGVTLGAKEPDMGFTLSARPVIGNGVTIGAGAKIIGHVTVGDHAKIGANAVVLNDVPAHATAVGIPARIVKKIPS